MAGGQVVFGGTSNAGGGGTLSGSGTSTDIAVWTGASTLGNSQAQELAVDPLETSPSLTYGTVVNSTNPTAGAFLQVHTAFSQGLTAYCHETSGTHPFRNSQISLVKSRGTQASPSAVLSGDVLGTVAAGGFDGTNYEFRNDGYIGGGGPSIVFTSIGNWSATDHNGNITFFINRVGASSSIQHSVFNADAAASAVFSGPVKTGFSTVALLPAGSEGWMWYATNGRKVGEGAGSGTGVPVYFSNGQWRVFSTDAQVAA